MELNASRAAARTDPGGEPSEHVSIKGHF
jgi:hypothetical protein